ncbi:MAG: hypothetical protein ACJ8BW_30290 [Ktedonobacteraceae bacterium]
MEFSEYQLLYIQTVYDYFRENLHWPTYRQVQRKILPTHRDFRVVEVVKSIEDNPASHFHQNLDTQVAITLKEIHHLPEAEQDLANLVKLMRYSVEKYLTEDKDRVQVTSEEVSHNLQFDETTIRKNFQLLGLTLGVMGPSSNSLDYKTWYFEVSDSAIDYQDLKSIDDYFERRDEIKKSYQASRSPQNAAAIISQNYDTSAFVMKKRIAPEVINAISDPKIKQICIELNSTPEQNVISLMQGLGEALKWTLNYRAKQVPGASSIPRKKIGDLGPLLDDAINVPYYSDNASNRFLEVFKNYFLKAFYDAVRHDAAFIPDLVVINNAVAGLEYLLRVTFP